jgi:hypothetical protein
MPTLEQIRAHEVRELRLMMVYFAALMGAAAVVIVGLISAL